MYRYRKSGQHRMVLADGQSALAAAGWTLEGTSWRVPTQSGPAPTSTAPTSAVPTTTAAAPTSGSNSPTSTGTAPAMPPTSSFPNASNTGVPAGTKLKVVNGRLTVTTPGQVVDGIDLHGDLVIEAPNVTIRNSIIRGANPKKVACVVFAMDPRVKNLTLTNDEINPQYVTTYQAAGICGGNFTASHLNVHGVVDGIKMHGDNATLEDSYVHDLKWYAHDPNYSNGKSHSDGVQLDGGSHLRLIHNAIYGGNNSCVQVTQGYAPVVDFVSQQNYFYEHDSYPMKVNQTPRASMSTVTITDNYFGSYTTKESWAIIATDKVSLVTGGNYWLDTGKPARSVIAS